MPNEQQLRILREWPEELQPTYRLHHSGVESLSDAELLALLLRSGLPGEPVLHLAERVLAVFGGISGLSQAAFSELTELKGIGQVKAQQLQAVWELGRRLQVADIKPGYRIIAPADAARLLMPRIGHMPQEHLVVLLLNTRNRFMGLETIYIGNINSLLVNVGEVFYPAIRDRAKAIIVGHNHPAGEVTPSAEDVRTTEALVSAGQLLNIQVLDHLVVSSHDFHSIREQETGISWEVSSTFSQAGRK